MKIQKIVLIFVLIFAGFFTYGQQKPVNPPNTNNTSQFNPATFEPAFNIKDKISITARPFHSQMNYQTISAQHLEHVSLKIVSRDANGLPIFIEGQLSKSGFNKDLRKQSLDYLKAIQKEMQIKSPENEFELISEKTDELGYTHLRMQQVSNGLPVFGAEVILHAKGDHISTFNGRYFPSPEIENYQPAFSAEAATEMLKKDLQKTSDIKSLGAESLSLLGNPDMEPKLVIYHEHQDADKEKLVWHSRFFPSLSEQWEYFIDAQTGRILHKINALCKTHHDHSCDHAPNPNPEGPTTAVASDLQGANQTIHTYQTTDGYFLVDASRNTMFNAGASNIPNDGVGIIWTIDAQNNAPDFNGDLDLVHVHSSNNSWNNPTSVSAHGNAGKAFEFFLDNFNRNSINGQGGNITSIINFTEDGSGMDNAFWNGAAMFYGNGGTAFNSPLAKALDVGGHEMSHGVIQHTANLIYEGQSGAMNESFADVFGVLIENETWEIGEDVVNTNIFPSGALRNMADPHNGSSQGGNGWQPASMSEYMNLPNTPESDNGGVHINSGIPNRAFYLLAADESVGSTTAGKIYYRALDQYLTKSSQFIDLRLAVVQAASDLYGSTSSAVTAAKSAFDQVEIFNGTPTETQQDLPDNPGGDFIMSTGINFEKLYLYDVGANSEIVVSTTKIKTRPSLTDDGTVAVFVADDGTLRALILNSDTGVYDEVYIENDPPQTNWRNIAISKDGSKIAMLTDDLDNSVLVFDYNSSTSETFYLYNPSTASGVTTGGVEYADILEWDYTGENLLYDAYNQLDDEFGNGTSYWDIGFMRVWDNNSQDFGDGFIFKLFSGLPEQTSVGNPTFAKKSPYVIALDFIDDSGSSPEYYCLSVNTETGDIGTIVQNDNWSVPNFSPDDNFLLYENIDVFGDIRIKTIPLASDLLSPADDPSDLINGGKWGAWFALGERDFTASEEIRLPIHTINTFPNPFEEVLTLEIDIKSSTAAQIMIFDMLGKQCFQKEAVFFEGNNKVSLPLENLSSGNYLLKVITEEGSALVKITKG